MLYEYQWLVIIGGFLSFAMSWGIGANDVANSFATAIGAKTLTLFQACCIAACLEFAGSVALGGEVSKTIGSSIAKPEAFKDRPEVFAYGMLCSLLSATMWVAFASYKGLAVSTTHSIIGSVIGFTCVWKGTNAIIWVQPTDEFPYVKGLVPIIISWFSSPLLSACLSIIIFLGNKYLVLQNKNAYYALPPLVFLTFFINFFFILYKGAKAELHWDADKAAWVSTIIAGGASILSAIIGIPYIKRKVQNRARIEPIQEPLQIETGIPVDESPVLPAKLIENQSKLTQIWKHMNTEIITNNEKQIPDNTNEEIYQYLQVFSSCSVAFAHGANDVANAVGAYAVILHVYENASISSSVITPKWMLVLGGSGIVIGLWTYGYKVIKSLGGELCALTASRGFSAELATALCVSFASVYGIPISTTHCIVGAEVGIGLTENLKTGVNWKLFGKTFLSWIATLVICGLLSALFFSQGIYAPSKIMYITNITNATGTREYITAA